VYLRRRAPATLRSASRGNAADHGLEHSWLINEARFVEGNAARSAVWPAIVTRAKQKRGNDEEASRDDGLERSNRDRPTFSGNSRLKFRREPRGRLFASTCPQRIGQSANVCPRALSRFINVSFSCRRDEEKGREREGAFPWADDDGDDAAVIFAAVYLERASIPRVPREAGRLSRGANDVREELDRRNSADGNEDGRCRGRRYVACTLTARRRAA